MDLRQQPSDALFQAEVVAFLRQALVTRLRGRNDGAQHSTREETLEWQRVLYERGWGAPHWPREHGGTGWSPLQRLIFDTECASHGAPWINAQGMGLLGPVVNAFGTPSQRERFISPLIRGQTYWCQGFSEPGAGSDLASLQTSARRVDDGYVVSGQKIWTSHAQHADWIFMLVRTSKGARKQEGITFMAAPMSASGITVRQIRTIDGLEHLNEVFFDDLQVPFENVIGAEGQGWQVAKYLLQNERVFGACDLPGMLRDLQRLKSTVAQTETHVGPLLESSALAQSVAWLDIQAQAMRMAFMRAISPTSGASPERSALLGSVLKVKVTELHQQIVALLFDVLGDQAALFCPQPGHAGAQDPVRKTLGQDLAKVSSELMYRRAISIHGGTNEIQRDIIARLMLGAPGGQPA